MKSAPTSILVALISFGLLVPAYADVIPAGTSPDNAPDARSLTPADLAFFSANPGASQTAAGLTADEFVYGSILLIVTIGIIAVLRARNTRHTG